MLIAGSTAQAQWSAADLNPNGADVSDAFGGAGLSGNVSRHIQMLVAGQTLGTRYHIIRLLGTGGMGAVYHAWDTELGVAVALKVIRGDVSDDPRSVADIERRFKRELLLTHH